MPRKVALERTQEDEHPNVELGSVREGWELIRPTVGERYFLFTDSGAVFRSSRVTQVGNGGFQTRNSAYAIRVIEEEAQGPLVTQELVVPITSPVR